MSFIGFLGGGLLGAFLAPHILGRFSMTGFGALILVSLIVLTCATLGQAITAMVGRRIRSRMTWNSVQTLDHFGGSVLNVVALGLVVWLLASAMAVLPNNSFTASVRQSKMLAGIDQLIPDSARDAFSNLRDLVDASGMPRVFSSISEDLGPDVAVPDPGAGKSAQIKAALASLVRVSGSAYDCGTDVTGSGFVYAPERVMTNAHVVAGVQEITIQIGGVGKRYDAEVVEFDPQIDIAVLLVPGLQAPSLTFAQQPLESGDLAASAGFPGGGNLEVNPARIRTMVQARGEDIYGSAGVVREVYSFRGNIIPGDSGGPLLSPSTGDVVGVVFASAVGDPTTGYAITASQAESDASEGLTASQPLDTGSCHLR